MRWTADKVLFTNTCIIHRLTNKFLVVELKTSIGPLKWYVCLSKTVPLLKTRQKFYKVNHLNS